MPKGIFDMDAKSFKSLEKQIKKYPTVMKFAGVGVINKMAFAARGIAVEEVNTSMTQRTKTFTSSHIRVTPARGKDLFRAKAIMGAGHKSGEDFDGWLVQQTGQGDDRKKSISVRARTSNSTGKKVRGKSKVNNQRIRRASQWEGKGRMGGSSQTTVAMLKDAKAGRFKDPFIIDGRQLKGRLHNFKHGLYQMQGKKLKRLQNFEDAPAKTARNPWMTNAMIKFDRVYDLEKAWSRAIKRSLKQARKFK